MSALRVGSVAACIGLGALAACGSPDAPAVVHTAADTAVEITFAGRVLEPAQAVSVSVALAVGGARRAVPAEQVVWTSSDSTIATISGGVMTGRQPGLVAITAKVGARSASQDVTVQWQPDATLSLTIPGSSIAVGAHFQSDALVRNQRRVAATQWTSDDGAVALVDSLGVVTPLAVGRVTIRAQFAGLAGSATFDVVQQAAPQGFGYIYSDDAPSIDPYDDGVLWNPPSGKSYSTASTGGLLLAPPYPTAVDLGWIGFAAPMSDALLHVVPFDVTPCAAYANDRLDLRWMALGVPNVDCFDRQQLRSSARMELIAMNPGAFSGRVALVRPGMPSIMSNGTLIHEVTADAGATDYDVPRLARDSLYWFVSPARSELGNCSLAADRNTPAGAVARVYCRTSLGVPADRAVYAIGFGADAVRGSNPRAFVETDLSGNLVRASMTTGLTISAARAPLPSITYDLVIAGERVADFDRLPAVFLTPVSSNAPACTMSASRASPTQVTLRVTCALAVDGLMIGAVY
jgi:hypothetical protein